MKQAPLYLIAERQPRNAERPAHQDGRVHDSDGTEFTSAFENAAIGMALVGPDSRRVRVNRAFCLMLGYAEDELLARSAREITHPDDLAEDICQRDLCLAGKKHGYQREKRYLHRDGRILWAHVTSTLVRDGAGQPLHFISQVQDITQQKVAEQRLRDTQALLHMAAQIGRLGAWAYEPGTPCVIWSEEVCAIHEVKQGFAPTSRQALLFFAPQYRDTMRRTLRACLGEGSPFDVEAQIVTAKGRTAWVRVIGEAEWDAQGRVRRIQGACQDICETKRAAEETRLMAEQLLRLNVELEERVKRRTAQLEAANKELEAFSYSIAHDLRSPLSSIDGFTHMLEETVGEELAERCGHYLSRIRAGVRQMGELTDGLLSLANLSRASLRTEKVDLAVLARAAMVSCQERSPERSVVVDIAPTLPVRGDPRLLSQVVGNLVGNAWKFTARKDHARIEVGSLPDADGREVYFVRDNGAGFDMAYAAKMFEAFQRMHTPAEFEGTGIGLAIVHKVVARHGGRIWARAAPERGACFYFTLGRPAD